jgi:hypothetical protein
VCVCVYVCMCVCVLCDVVCVCVCVCLCDVVCVCVYVCMCVCVLCDVVCVCVCVCMNMLCDVQSLSMFAHDYFLVSSWQGSVMDKTLIHRHIRKPHLSSKSAFLPTEGMPLDLHRFRRSATDIFARRSSFCPPRSPRL